MMRLGSRFKVVLMDRHMPVSSRGISKGRGKLTPRARARHAAGYGWHRGDENHEKVRRRGMCPVHSSPRTLCAVSLGSSPSSASRATARTLTSLPRVSGRACVRMRCARDARAGHAGSAFAGAVRVVTKPISTDVLLQVVRSYGCADDSEPRGSEFRSVPRSVMSSGLLSALSAAPGGQPGDAAEL